MTLLAPPKTEKTASSSLLSIVWTSSYLTSAYNTSKRQKLLCENINIYIYEKTNALTYLADNEKLRRK